MDWKIGEIFEYKGEWYQCIIGHCNQCSFDKVGTCKFIGNPYCAYRNDKKLVCFKKLEKVGEPMKIHNRLVLKVKADAYNCMRCCFYSKTNCELTMQECEHYDCGKGTKFIEIKQTKEDMEEKNWTLDDAIKHYDEIGKSSISQECSKKNHQVRDWLVELKQYKKHSNSEKIGKNLKEFNLEAAKSGKPVCTRDGRKARIICFDRKHCHQGHDYPIVALISEGCYDEFLCSYTKDGLFAPSECYNTDLMMLPEKKEGWVNVYKDSVYDTKDEAIDGTYEGRGYIDTVKIEWEE